MPWLELAIDLEGEDTLEVEARASDGKGARQQVAGGKDFLRFRDQLMRAADERRPKLPPDVLAMAQQLYLRLFAGELLVRLRELENGPAGEGEGRLLLFKLGTPDLASVPWEALCRPPGKVDFLGLETGFHVARRVVADQESYMARDVEGGVLRGLALAPHGGDAALLGLREAINDGALEWLPDLKGKYANRERLLDALAGKSRRNILHFIGHGRVNDTHDPQLRLADEAQGREFWIDVDVLALQLKTHFTGDLRLIFLESCQGGAPGALGSAAEILMQKGAGAVIAHLWNVREDAAQKISSWFYGAFTGPHVGNVAASVRHARTQLLTSGDDAALFAFSPVLYLRGEDPVLFTLGERVVDGGNDPGITPPPPVPPVLVPLLKDQGFSLVLGDKGDAARAVREKLRALLVEELSGEVPTEELRAMPLAALTQRHSLSARSNELNDLLDAALPPEGTNAVPPLLDGIAREMKPGVHVSLLWHPALEDAIARRHPKREVYALHPPLRGMSGPGILRRRVGAEPWRPVLKSTRPDAPPLDDAFIILRLYGGRGSELGTSLLTEDHYIQGLISLPLLVPADWKNSIVGALQSRPMLFMDVAPLDWRHRMLLRLLFQSAPSDSVAVLLGEAKAEDEAPIWTERGGGLASARVGVLRAAELAEALRKLNGGAR